MVSATRGRELWERWVHAEVRGGGGGVNMPVVVAGVQFHSGMCCWYVCARRGQEAGGQAAPAAPTAVMRRVCSRAVNTVGSTTTLSPSELLEDASSWVCGTRCLLR